MQSPTHGATNNGVVEKKIRVLVCTANMGNEPPDQLSLNCWIPRDGDVAAVLEDQPYPMHANMKAKFKSVVEKVIVSGDSQSQSNCDDGGENAKDRFDIIAIGMQEATFQVESSENHKLVKNVKKLTTQVTDLTGTSDYHKPKTNVAMHGIRKITSIVRGEKVKELNKSQSKIDPQKSAGSMHISERKEVEASERGEADTRFLHQMLQDHLPSYTRVVSYQRGQMRLMIFYNELEISLEVLSIQAQNTGKAGLANKGGIVAECNINNGTRIAFLTAHLEAHEGESKYKTRCSTVGDIFRGTRSSVPDFHCDASLASHFTFAMGDLNFRTRLPDFEPGSQEHIDETHRLAQTKAWSTINRHDELTHAMENNDCLSGFKTLKCNFPCTFKVHRMDGYTYNEKRSPSYTDRILYNANHLLWDRIRPLAYEPIDHFTTSDHKPIRGAFEIDLNSTIQWRPVLVREYQSFRATGRRRKLKGASHGKMENPSIYVSFMSTPSVVMKKHVTRKEKMLKMLGIAKSKKVGEGSAMKTQMGWPRTKCTTKTCDPEWPDEIHFKVQTHHPTGAAMNLTGALLHILLYESKDNDHSIVNDHLMGSCTLNLAFLISKFRLRLDRPHLQSDPSDSSFDRKSKLASFVVNQFQRVTSNERSSNFSEKYPSVNDTHSRNTLQDDKENKEQKMEFSASENREDVLENICAVSETVVKGCSSEESGASVAIENGPSNALRSVYHSPLFCSTTKRKTQNALKQSMVAAPGNDTSLDSLGIQSMTIDEPLMKNGREVGRISFTLDTWWLDPKRAVSHDPQVLPRQQHKEVFSSRRTRKNRRVN